MAEVFTGKPLFPGSSTLNQIERVLMWTGTPTMNDLEALKTNFGKQLIDLISTIKQANKK
jgi:mitogen-activated protein kinase 15